MDPREQTFNTSAGYYSPVQVWGIIPPVQVWGIIPQYNTIFWHVWSCEDIIGGSAVSLDGGTLAVCECPLLVMSTLLFAAFLDAAERTNSLFYCEICKEH